METTDDFPNLRTHGGLNLDPPGHSDAAQSIMTSANKQTVNQSSSVQVLDSCEYLERATHSLDPLAAFDTRHHATPPIHQSFHQQHAPVPALASASVQPDIAMDISIVQPNIAMDMSNLQPYAGLNPSGDVLEHCKEEIQTLYASNTLELVREKINSKYHLTASSKMYKDRIRKWGYNKNVKAPEKDAILRKQIQRSHAGKSSEFEIRNITNLPSKLSRYRKKINLRTDQQALALRAATPPGLICRTPSPKPPLRMPNELESPELVVRAIQEHVCGMLDAGIWRPTRNTVHIKLETPREREKRKSMFSKFCSIWVHALVDLQDEEYTRAFKWLNVTMSMAGDMIRCQDPQTLNIICESLGAFLHSEGCQTMAHSMLNHFAAVSAVVLGRRHPFSILFDNLLHTDGATIVHNIALGARVAADMFAQKFGRFNEVSAFAKSCAVYLMPDLDQRIDILSRFASEMRDTLGSNSRLYWNTCFDLTHLFLSGEEYQRAAELAETLIDHTAAANNPMRRCRALRGLAGAQKQLGKTIFAEKNVREAIRVTAEMRGWEDPTTLHYLSSLADWLDDWGRTEDAASVRTDHENILVTMFDKLQLEEEERFRIHRITDASVS